MARPPKLDMKGINPRGDRFYWDVTRTLPNGQKWRKASDHATAEDAVAARADALAEFERLKAGEELIADQGYSVAAWCDHCLDAILPHTANRRGKPYEPNTLDNYRTILKGHAYPKIGSVRLTAVTSDHLDPLLAGLPSVSIKQNVRKALSVAFSLAEKRGKRPKGSNPCRDLRLPNPKRERTSGRRIVVHERDVATGRTKATTEIAVPDGLAVETVRVLSFAEEAALLAHVAHHPRNSDYLALILLGLRAGLRIGEALGLDWSAVDFDAGTITVDQQVQRVTGKGLVVSDPKSQAGHRTIPMTRSLAEHLRGVRILSASPHVVHNNKGERREAARTAHRLRLLIEGAGLHDKIEGRRFVPRPTFHDLRRTCLTRLATGHVAEGVQVTPVPPTTLIRFSGHEDVTTLLSFYTAADDGMVAKAVAAMP